MRGLGDVLVDQQPNAGAIGPTPFTTPGGFFMTPQMVAPGAQGTPGAGAGTPGYASTPGYAGTPGGQQGTPYSAGTPGGQGTPYSAGTNPSSLSSYLPVLLIGGVLFLFMAGRQKRH